MPFDPQALKAFLRKHKTFINTLNVGENKPSVQKFLDICLGVIRHEKIAPKAEDLKDIEMFMQNPALMKMLQTKAAKNKSLDTFKSFSDEKKALPQQAKKTLSSDREILRERIEKAKQQQSFMKQPISKDRPSRTEGLFITRDNILHELELQKQKVEQRKKQGLTRHPSTSSDTSLTRASTTSSDSLSPKSNDRRHHLK